MKSTFATSIFVFSSLVLLTSYGCEKSPPESEPPCIQAGDALIVYSNANSVSSFWIPGGWMPDGKGINYQDNFTESPHSAPECIKINVNIAELKLGWCGIYWLAQNSWDGPGVNICEPKTFKVEFWARGAQGGERVQFKVGGVTDGDDSIQPAIETSWIELTTEWTLYSLDLSGKDLSNIVGGFCWVTAIDKNPGKTMITFYLDDIKYVLQ